MYGNSAVDLSSQFPKLIAAQECALSLAHNPVATADFFEFSWRCCFEYLLGCVTDLDRVHKQRQSTAPIKVVLDQDQQKCSFVGLWTPAGSRAKSRSIRLASFPRS
jgi:hypothetical protein